MIDFDIDESIAYFGVAVVAIVLFAILVGWLP